MEKLRQKRARLKLGREEYDDSDVECWNGTVGGAKAADLRSTYRSTI